MRWLFFLGCLALLAGVGLHAATKTSCTLSQPKKAQTLQAEQHPLMEAELVMTYALPLLEEHDHEAIAIARAGGGWLLLLRQGQGARKQLVSYFDSSGTHHPPPEA